MRQNALVSSLFPKNIQKQLMEDLDAENVKNKTGRAGLRTFLNEEAMTCGVEIEIGIGQYREEIMPMTETALEACAQLVVMRCEATGFGISM